MTLLRKATVSFGWAALVLATSHILLFAQGLPGLLWLATLLRVGCLAAIAPALLVKYWSALHLEIPLPTLLLVWLLFVGYGQFWWTLGRLRVLLDLPAKPGRRAFLASGGVVAVTGYGTVRAYPPPQIIHRDLRLADLPPLLVGRRLVLLSDLHRGPAIGREYLEAVMEQVNRLDPDLILLPGDFVSCSSVYFSDVTAILGQLRPRIASLATLGNHDHWQGSEEAKVALTRAGVVLLHNRAVYLRDDGQIQTVQELDPELMGRVLCLAGVDDLGAGQPDLSLALTGVGPKVPTILLSHNPDFAEDEEAQALGRRIDLQLSGHTHGGQVVLPGVGPVVSASHYGLKYLYGLVQGPCWPVLITRGVGASVPLRIGAPPEIVVLELGRPLRPSRARQETI